MIKKFIWPLFILISIVIFFYLLTAKPVNNGGDMVEYFGMTESLINHKSINLTNQDYNNLKQYLAPGYFDIEKRYVDTKGGFFAYVSGVDGNTYSLHFWAYSILAAPVRLILRFFQMNELNCLRITNFLILTTAVGYILKKFVKDPKRQLLLILSVYLSPLVFFITYPGVDVFYMALLLVAIFAFFNKKFIQSASFLGVASWHSQPLAILAMANIGYYFLNSLNSARHPRDLSLEARRAKWEGGDPSEIVPPQRDPVLAWTSPDLIGIAMTDKWVTKQIIICMGLILIVLIPYFANIYMFGVLSPWSSITDGWTTLYGFGLQNLSLKKLYEQFFDLNIGLFWYAPALMIIGLYYLIKLSRHSKPYLIILGLILLTAFAYQTNPAWHYGTAGFAPTRHILFVIPFLIYFTVTYFKISHTSFNLIAIPLLFQLLSLTFNNYISPDFYNSLFQSPYATYVLNNFPKFYNPTAKIFVDNTTHTDKKFITTAIYKYDEVCKKAFVTKTDIKKLEKECGFIPEQYLKNLEDDFKKKANYPRTTYTIEATFWPDPESCGPGYKAPLGKPYICMRTLKDFVKQTGIKDTSRIKKLGYDGVWQLEKGDVAKITVPAGYIIDYYSLEGTYVNY